MTYPPADRVTPIDGDNHRHPPRWNEEIERLQARVAELEAVDHSERIARRMGATFAPAMTTDNETVLRETEVLRLVVMYDDGEHDPHEAEQCGIFPDLDTVCDYVEHRFKEGHYKAVAREDGDSWNLIDRDSDEDTDLALIVWRETLFSRPASAPHPFSGTTFETRKERSAREADSAPKGVVEALREAAEVLKFYGNPRIYEPHPHGPAFDRRDMSFNARAYLDKFENTLAALSVSVDEGER